MFSICSCNICNHNLQEIYIELYVIVILSAICHNYTECLTIRKPNNEKYIHDFRINLSLMGMSEEIVYRKFLILKSNMFCF